MCEIEIGNGGLVQALWYQKFLTNDWGGNLRQEINTNSCECKVYNSGIEYIVMIVEYLILKWKAWRRHQMEKFSALLALCVGNSPVTGEFPAQRPVTRTFDVFFDPRLE